jgi:hypothetical protein
MTIVRRTQDSETFTVGGTPTELYDTLSADSMQIDYRGNTVYINYYTGTPADNTFNPGQPHATNYWLSLDLNTGNWSSNNTSGTLDSTALASVVVTFKALRNSVESMALNIGALLGTHVNWT